MTIALTKSQPLAKLTDDPEHPALLGADPEHVSVYRRFLAGERPCDISRSLGASNRRRAWTIITNMRDRIRTAMRSATNASSSSSSPSPSPSRAPAPSPRSGEGAERSEAGGAPSGAHSPPRSGCQVPGASSLFSGHNLPLGARACLSDLEWHILAAANVAAQDKAKELGGHIAEIDLASLRLSTHKHGGDNLHQLTLALRTLQQRRILIYHMFSASGRTIVLMAPWSHSSALALRATQLIFAGGIDTTAALCDVDPDDADASLSSAA